ncbi:hypothetical protein XELAEV_18025187mg [Xenopus laevis]|uniref:Tetratricopeptide SHNi-TPR domain-containing protein n=1 Tax=Xenopus laevis TaxID=8355 RepID=A0A974D1H3_XENLA|nr:hypothetical protein XELAEV_18025187mg [Xenopus laevis]
MAEETAALSTEKTEDTSTAPSTSAEKADGIDIDTEAKRLMGAGQKHLVMKDVRSAVNLFQEASSLLAKQYGETADECAEAFYSYGMSLLELARLENGVLGNALEGMPEDDEEEAEKEEDPNIPSADNLDEKEREQLREQVYDAMAEDQRAPDDTSESEAKGKPEGDSKDKEADEKMKNGQKETEKVTDDLKIDSASRDVPMDKSGKGEPPESKDAETLVEQKESKPETLKEKSIETKEKDLSKEKTDAKETANQSPDSTEVAEEKMDSEASESKESTSIPPTENEANKPDDPEKMEEEEEGEDSEENEDGTEENEGTEEKETEEEDVGNLQLAWEMLDLCKIIFKRQQSKEAQLKAAQAHQKLGEVCIESENYSQAVEDFLACLNIQKEHLEEHDRLLAETHYHLGLAYQYSSKHEEAISHFTQSIGVIEKRMDVLTKQLEASVGELVDEVEKEMDELKDLLPDIKEKIEDSKEAQKNATVTEKALKETLVGGSSGFSKENGSTSSSSAVEKSGDSTVPVTNCVSDISHLVRKKRKTEEESPLKDKDAKKSKQEPVANGAGNGDAVVPTNEEAEKAEEASMETATVESTA